MHHLNRLLLLAIARGELPASLAVGIAMDHVLTFCPECRKEIELAQREIAASEPPPAAPGVLSTVIRRHVAEQRKELAKAQRDLAVLLKLPEEDRLIRIMGARSRFQGAYFVQVLLDKSQEVIASHPDEAVHFAELALSAAMRTYTKQDSPTHVRILGQLANASRAAGRFDAADKHFETARRVVRNHELAEDPALLARLDDLESSLRIDQRRLERAEELLARSLFLYNLAGAPVPDRARVLVNLGVVYQLQGNLLEAIDITTAALDAVAKAPGELKLSFAALYNIATFHVDLGNPQAAVRVITENKEVVEAIKEPIYLVRLIGLRGKIAAAKGDLAAAEEALLNTRNAFLAGGAAFAYDAAIVSLDLAMIYAKQGRTTDLRETVESMVPIFQTNKLHQEALAAVLLLRDAVRERASLALLERVTSYMREAQRNPSLKFETASEP